MSDDEPRDAAAPSRRRRWFKGVAIGVALLLVVLATTFVVAYQRFEGNINVAQVDLGDEADRPAEVEVEGPQEPLTVLVMGSDSREGTNIGGETPGLSDTTMLLHVSADRSRAFGVSIPRDLMVDRPECTDADGDRVAGGLTQFNSAYAVGGPGCTVRTVEAMSDVRIDHFVVLDFAGFKNMVDAVGGVQVCVPNEVDDTIGNIYLPAGTYNVTGNQALDYVRVRHGLGLENGDIGRMKRQQAFIASMVEKVMSAGTLTNPVRLLRFLDAATKSLTTDEQFADLGELASLGSSLADIGTDNIRFLTVPNEAYEPDPNRLQLADGADQLFAKIRNDQPLGRFTADALAPGEAPDAVPSGSPSASPSGSPSGSPSASASPTPDDEALAAQRAEAEEQRRQAAIDAGLCV